ncbi:MAG: NAD-dependent epimerase/dehydratase family protein, partial [Woeseiaceae bacterium]
ICGEAMARAYHHRYGLNYVGLRYMNVYGPRQDYRGAYIAVIMEILDNIDKGLPPVVHGDGSQAYDFIYVEDCARANICAMKADTTDVFYNVGCGIKTTIAELAEMISKVAQFDLEIDYRPARPTSVRNRVSCPKKAQSEIGFQAKVALEDGLRRVFAWACQDKKRSLNVSPAKTTHAG